MDLTGKVVIVTGAARGIGQEYVRSLGKVGASMVAADINSCDETVKLAQAEGVKAIGVKLDVADMQSARGVADAAIAAFGRIDGLINNAALYGALKGGRFDTLSEADWDAAMTVNVKGVWNCCKAVAPHMRKAGGGSIINISSLAAAYGTPFVLHYTTSKAAVGGMTRGLARELGRDRHPRQRNGAVRGLDGSHQRILRLQARRRIGDDQNDASDPEQSQALGPCRHGAMALVRRQPVRHRSDDRRRRWNLDALTARPRPQG